MPSLNPFTFAYIFGLFLIFCIMLGVASKRPNWFSDLILILLAIAFAVWMLGGAIFLQAYGYWSVG